VTDILFSAASGPCYFTPSEKAPGNPHIERWAGLRAGLDAMEKNIKMFHNSQMGMAQHKENCSQLLHIKK
jgi:hypothetical protein